MQTIFKNNLMALDKTKSIQHAIQDGCQRGNVIWLQFIKWLPTWFFQKLQSNLNWIIWGSYIWKPKCCVHLISLILQSPY